MTGRRFLLPVLVVDETDGVALASAWPTENKATTRKGIAEKCRLAFLCQFSTTIKSNIINFLLTYTFIGSHSTVLTLLFATDISPNESADFSRHASEAMNCL